MVSFEMNDLKKIGLGLTGFGVFFSFLGIVFFFDKGLIAMGNILFLLGLGLTIGLKSTMQFFTKPKNYKGTISFGAGFFLVLIGWPLFGMLLEAYGFVVLFRKYQAAAEQLEARELEGQDQGGSCLVRNIVRFVPHLDCSSDLGTVIVLNLAATPLELRCLRSASTNIPRNGVSSHLQEL